MENVTLILTYFLFWLIGLLLFVYLWGFFQELYYKVKYSHKKIKINGIYKHRYSEEEVVVLNKSDFVTLVQLKSSLELKTFESKDFLYYYELCKSSK